MNIIQPSVEIEKQDWDLLVKRIEKKGRVCYKSEDRITEDSAAAFVGMLIKSGHLSVLEHEKLSIKFIVDRGVSHELVRHWSASFSQESTRYCNYGNDDKGITVIEPFFYKKGCSKYDAWREACLTSEQMYLALLVHGSSAQEARDVLINSLKTEVWMTATVKDWLISIFPQRCSPKAHPQMRQAMIPTLLKMKELVPAIFGNISFDMGFPFEHYAEVIVAD